MKKKGLSAGGCSALLAHSLPSPALSTKASVAPQASPLGIFQSTQKGHIAIPNGGSHPGQMAVHWCGIGHHPN